MTGAGRNLVLMCGIAVSLVAAYWSLRLAWADHLSHAPDTVARAAQLTPGDADIRLQLANAREAAGGDPTPALEAAAALDPHNAGTEMRLGVAAEMHGNVGAAERHLLAAARLSRQFEPRWALASFYSRRRDPTYFWPWVREALQMAYGDCRPVFELCWNMSQNADEILARAIPERRAVLNAYLGFLLQQHRLAATGPVAVKLAALATHDDVPTLLAWCDSSLDAGSVATARDVWNTLCARRVLSYAPLDTRAPLTDGSFTTAPLGGGFGWRRPAVAGVAYGRNASPPYLWFSFSGKQPENCELLAQLVPVEPGASYRLRFEYRTSEIPPESGLRWRVADSNSPWLASPDWKAGEMRFTAAPNTALVRLSLTYERLPGATRIEGSLSLRRLSLERLP